MFSLIVVTTIPQLHTHERRGRGCALTMTFLRTVGVHLGKFAQGRPQIRCRGACRGVSLLWPEAIYIAVSYLYCCRILFSLIDVTIISRIHTSKGDDRGWWIRVCRIFLMDCRRPLWQRQRSHRTGGVEDCIVRTGGSTSRSSGH